MENKHNEKFNEIKSSPSTEDMMEELEKQKFQISDLKYDIEKLTNIVDDYLTDKFFNLLENNPFSSDLRTILDKKLTELVIAAKSGNYY